MKKGHNWGVEWKTEIDRRTGVEVIRLIDHAAHHYHLYFTNPGWYDNCNKLLLGGDRGNAANLFSIDLRSGELTQLTDFNDRQPVGFMLACVNHVTNEAHYWHAGKLWAMSLDTLEERPLWTLTPGFDGDMLNVTADGKYVMFTIIEEGPGRTRNDQLTGNVGFDDFWAFHPQCHVVRVPVDGSGKAEILHSNKTWMGHMNTSSTQPAHLTFCHEGPWDRIDNRIWAMDTASGKIWPLRERRGPGEAIGHEYWLADGERVGYHAFHQGKKFIGSVRFDGSGIVEHEFPCSSMHVHSNDESVIVGDGSPGNGMVGERGCVLLWKKNADGYDPTRVVCVHRSSMYLQFCHVHPRLSPDGRYVIFTSDRTAYATPYITRLPKDVTTLPFAE